MIARGAVLVGLVVGLVGCLPGPEFLTRTANVEIWVLDLLPGDVVTLDIDGQVTEATIADPLPDVTRFYDEVAPGSHRLQVYIARGAARWCGEDRFDASADDKTVLTVDVDDLPSCASGADAGPVDDAGPIEDAGGGGEDAGPGDAGLPDAGGEDAGAPDAGLLDEAADFVYLIEEVYRDDCPGGEDDCETVLHLNNNRTLVWRDVGEPPASAQVSLADYLFVVLPALDEDADELFEEGCATQPAGPEVMVRLKRKRLDDEGEDLEQNETVTGCTGTAATLRNRLRALRDVYFDDFDDD